jgi:hypothetical protein
MGNGKWELVIGKREMGIGKRGNGYRITYNGKRENRETDIVSSVGPEACHVKLMTSSQKQVSPFTFKVSGFTFPVPFFTSRPIG